MQKNTQLPLTLATSEQIQQAWAFAKATHKATKTAASRRRKAMADASQSIITACSKQARLLGVRTGMTYADAKQQLPELKILVIGA